jgi:hypothetical protein
VRAGTAVAVASGRVVEVVAAGVADGATALAVGSGWNVGHGTAVGVGSAGPGMAITNRLTTMLKTMTTLSAHRSF